MFSVYRCPSISKYPSYLPDSGELCFFHVTLRKCSPTHSGARLDTTWALFTIVATVGLGPKADRRVTCEVEIC